MDAEMSPIDPTGLNSRSEPTDPVVETREQAEQLSVELLRTFLNQDSFDPTQNYDRLTSYVKLRTNVLQTNKPVNLFLRFEFMEKTEFGSALRQARYDPVGRKFYRGDWPWTTRAFHLKEGGTFFDFPAHARGNPQQRVLEGYQAAESLISFAYTCEHESHHDRQQQRLDAKEISYDVLCLAKDHIALGVFSYCDGGENFYINAHDDLFLETDANDAANDLMRKVIPPDSTLAKRIVNPNDPPEHRFTVESLLSQRIAEGNANHHDNYSLSLGKNTIKIPPQDYNGSAEQIVSDLCDNALKVYPAYLKLHPVLALEYNEDGSRRSFADIQDILEEAKHSDSVLIGGQPVDSKRLRVIYHRLFRHSRKLQKEISSRGQRA